MSEVMEITESTELVHLIEESGLEKSKSEVLLERFQDYFKIASDWEKKAKTLEVTNETQVAEMKMAREGRLFLKNKRVEVEKTRKKLGQDALREKQTIDSIARILKNLIEPTEKFLLEQEKFAEIKEAERKEKLREERWEKISKYVENEDDYDLANMPDEGFKALLDGFVTAEKNRIEAERKAEEERKEQERKEKLLQSRKDEMVSLADFFDWNLLTTELTDAEYNKIQDSAKKAKTEYEAEQERIRKENERLKKEREEAERKAEAERKRQAKIEAERKRKEEAERKAREEKALKEREAYEAKLKKEREERQRFQTVIKAKEEAEEKARKQAEAEKKKAKLAPDKDKLYAFVKHLANIEMPDVKSKEAKKVVTDAEKLIRKTMRFINESAEKL